MHSFTDENAVKTLGSHTYQVDLAEEWCIGSVPHGGYVTACFLAVAQRHFATTLASRKQPYALAMHVQFLRRTSVGPAIFTVQDKKLGGQTSVVHVSLVQDGDREEVVAYITHCNLPALNGLTLETKWSLAPPSVTPVDLVKLARGHDDRWTPWLPTPANFRKALQQYEFYVPSAGREIDSVADSWLRLKHGHRFNNIALGSVSDTFPMLIEGYGNELKKHFGLQPQDKMPGLWYPTLSLNIEFKKTLPEEGVEWLFSRVRAKEIKNGRNDIEIIIMDEHGDLIATSHHIAMVLDASRNTAARSNKAKATQDDDNDDNDDSAGTKSKI